jgi:hypothetical protein
MSFSCALYACQLNRTKGQEKFEDTKGIIRIRITKKTRQHNTKEKVQKGQTMICKPLFRKLKNEQHELLSKPRVTHVLCLMQKVSA